ncbi:hypothetical protein [Metapseudomonas sp. CR1201]
MLELQLRPDGQLDWFLRGTDKGQGDFGPITYHDYEEAIAEAKSTNIKLASIIDLLPLPIDQRESLRLKVQKALTAAERLSSEERLMLAEAVRRHADDPRPSLQDLEVADFPDTVRIALHAQLQTYPYIRWACLGQYGLVLQRDGEFTWLNYGRVNNKAETFCYREKIARGFGFSGTDHWGKTKAAIRDELLPRANKLLHLASVKRLLADALHRGQRVLIVGEFVFWYEDGKVPQWVVKQVGAAGAAADGEALWREGTILSKNHGRIVVLPYIKEGGEKVQGHTKNAPHDGRALPRHPDDYIELPFEVLDGDLMYGLFGELNYE